MTDKLRFAAMEVGDRLLAWRLPRLAFASLAVGRSVLFALLGRRYEATDALLRYVRIASTRHPAATHGLLGRVADRVARRCAREGAPNHLLRSYRATREADAHRQQFAAYGLEHMRVLKYPRPNDSPEREGNLLLLKPWIPPAEKGVVLVQYTATFDQFAAIYDLASLARHYRLVLEPSTWGYREARLLVFLGLPSDVVVEAQYRPDFDFVERLGHNLRPVHLGAGDWVDPDLFCRDEAVVKMYDVIMVASWLSLKRHRLLFSALASCRDRIGRVALVGYPWAGRTAADIRSEAAEFGVEDRLDLFEKVSPARVSDLLRKSKVSIMLSKREGASRAIYESWFSDVPVLLSADNIGVNREHICEATGALVRDEDLASKLVEMVENYQQYHPREWALMHTGYRHSTAALNGCLRSLALHAGEPWSRDIFLRKNVPNAMLVRDAERRESRAALDDLNQFLS